MAQQKASLSAEDLRKDPSLTKELFAALEEVIRPVFNVAYPNIRNWKVSSSIATAYAVAIVIYIDFKHDIGIVKDANNDVTDLVAKFPEKKSLISQSLSDVVIPLSGGRSARVSFPQIECKLNARFDTRLSASNANYHGTLTFEVDMDAHLTVTNTPIPASTPAIAASIPVAIPQPINNTLVFRSDEDILEMVDTLTAQAKDAEIGPVSYVYDPKQMIRCGLWPALANDPSSTIKYIPPKWYSDWLGGMNVDALNFWHDSYNVRAYIDAIQKAKLWQFRTLESWKRDALENASSLQLLLYAPELTYTGSKRPITDMSLFRSPTSRTIRRSEINNNAVMIDGEQWNVIPVARYAKGMRRGLFFEGDNSESASKEDEFCGTFYYNEPESTTLLAYRTSIRSFNKTTAMSSLDPSSLEALKYDPASKIGRLLPAFIEIMKHVNGVYPRNLMMTPAEVRKLQSVIGYDPLPAQQEPHYAGNRLYLYALEDYLDQPLCMAAKSNNIDVVILENMVGSHQVVTEVLDARNREDSFRSLIYVVD